MLLKPEKVRFTGASFWQTTTSPVTVALGAGMTAKRAFCDKLREQFPAAALETVFNTKLKVPGFDVGNCSWAVLDVDVENNVGAATPFKVYWNAYGGIPPVPLKVMVGALPYWQTMVVSMLMDAFGGAVTVSTVLLTDAGGQGWVPDPATLVRLKVYAPAMEVFTGMVAVLEPAGELTTKSGPLLMLYTNE